MQEKRKYRRFRGDAPKIHGKMVLAKKVDIVDISVDGVALKADRRLDIGREYPIQLEYEGKSINVKGVVVRSLLSGTEKRGGSDLVPIYTAGLIFKESTTEKVAHFLNAITLGNKEELPIKNDRRRNVRFRITTHGDAVLSFPIDYRVIKISMTGMLIQTDQALEKESMVPMELSIHERDAITFKGRVALCRHFDDTGGRHYEIGVEFLHLRDEVRKVLQSFIDYLAATEGNIPGNPSGRENS
jgi:hypothetical protein